MTQNINQCTRLILAFISSGLHIIWQIGERFNQTSIVLNWRMVQLFLFLLRSGQARQRWHMQCPSTVAVNSNNKYAAGTVHSAMQCTCHAMQGVREGNDRTLLTFISAQLRGEGRGELVQGAADLDGTNTQQDQISERVVERNSLTVETIPIRAIRNDDLATKENSRGHR